MKHTFLKLLLPLLLAFSPLWADLGAAPGQLQKERTTLAVSKPTVIADNADSATVTATFLDRYDEPITNIMSTGNVVLLQTIDGLTTESSISAVDASQSAQGIYKFTVRSTVAESVTYSVRATADDVRGGSHTITIGNEAVLFVPGPLDISKTRLELSSNEASAGSVISANVYLFDAYGNKIKDFDTSRLSLQAVGDDSGETQVLPLSFDEYPQWETLHSNVVVHPITHNNSTNKYSWMIGDTRAENVSVAAKIDNIIRRNASVKFVPGDIDKSKTYSAVFTRDNNAPYGIGHVVRKLNYENYTLYAFVYDSYYNPIKIDYGLDIYSLVSKNNLNNTHTFGITNVSSISYVNKDVGIYSKNIKALLEDGKHYFFTAVKKPNYYAPATIIEQ